MYRTNSKKWDPQLYKTRDARGIQSQVNALNPSMRWRYIKEVVFFSVFRLSALVLAQALGGLLFDIVIRGVRSQW